MLLNINLIKPNKENKIHFSSDFSSERFKKIYPLKEVVSFDVDLSIYLFDDYLQIQIVGDAKLKLISSYTSKEFVDTIKISDELEFTLDENNDEFDYISTNEFELDEYLFGVLNANIPMVVFAKGETLPEGNDLYRVISSSDLEKEEKVDPRLKALDDIKL